MPKLSQILPVGALQVLWGMVSLVFLVQQDVSSSLVLFYCLGHRTNHYLRELWFFLVRTDIRNQNLVNLLLLECHYFSGQSQEK